jgi:putative phosphoribosyl transferase
MMRLSTRAEQVRIESADGTEEAGKHALEGFLCLPENPVGVVVITCMDSPRRLQPSNDYLASVMGQARLATLRVSLMQPGPGMGPSSGSGPGRRQPLALMSSRLQAVCDWVRRLPATDDLPIGLFAAGECAAAMMQVAMSSPRGIAALVSKGGRLDLAGRDVLCKVNVPSLLIVGSLDQRVLVHHRAALSAMRCKKRLEIIPGATHAFEEPGNLEVVARLARSWFLQHSTSSAISL